MGCWKRHSLKHKIAADGLWERVEMQVVFSIFLFQGCLLKDSGAKND